MYIGLIMWASQYIHDNLSKWQIDYWVLHTKWYPSVRIDEKNRSYTWTWEQIKWRSMSKQNRRWTSTSCWHCNACMIICLKCMAFAGRCTQRSLFSITKIYIFGIIVLTYIKWHEFHLWKHYSMICLPHFSHTPLVFALFSHIPPCFPTFQ